MHTYLRLYAILLFLFFFLFLNPDKSQAQIPDARITADYCSIEGKVRLTASGGGTYSWPYNGSTADHIDVDIAGIYRVFVTLNSQTAEASIEVSNEMVIDGSFTDFNSSSPAFYSEYTQHQAYWDPTAPSYTSGLGPEGYYAVNTQAWYNDLASTNGYHPNFHGRDHTNNTVGNRNFLLVNGSTSLVPDPPNADRQRIIWQQTVVILPNTYYYFSAWGMNLNPSNPARLQFEVNNVLVGTVADLNSAPKPDAENEVEISNWVQFYSDPKWYSGSLSGSVTIRIRNLNTASGGNDFGLDDISFGTLDIIQASIDPQVIIDSLCEGETINLKANVSGGKEPYSFSWSGPNSFTSDEENPSLLNSTFENSGTYIMVFNDGFGCTEQSASTIVTVFKPTYSSLTETACDSFTLNDETFTESGIYIQNLVNANGCDSTLTLHLTINESSSSELFETACDSLTINDITYFESGTFTQNLVNIAGCDSTLTLHLTINESTTSELFETACDSLTINDITYFESGIFTQNLVNVAGCDSTLTLHLTINESSSSDIFETTCDSFTLNDETFTESGIYIQNLVNANGCDSTLTLH
ncbi:MAG: hypothetical protein J7J72_00795, partial [Bacteroidales bacterium]|nr:hypothetical protein [Bacteroidales bacterium]